MILVDTDLWIDFFSGSDPGARAVERLLTQRRAALSAVSVFELFCGATTPRQIEELETLAAAVPLLALSPQSARLAGRHYVELKQQGRLIGNQDLMLAGTAAELGLPILTRNRSHFSRIPDLETLSPQEILAES